MQIHHKKSKKTGGVNSTDNAKDSKVEKILKGALVTLIAATGIGAVALTVWAFVHKYVAISDLNNFLLSYTTYERKQELCARRIKDEEKGIERLEEEINNASVIEENGIKVDPKTITYEELEEVFRNFGEYSEETRTRINSIKKEIQEIKENFLKLLEENKEALRILENSFDLDEIKSRKDFEVGTILGLFEKSKLYEDGSINFKLEYGKHVAMAYFLNFKKDNTAFSDEINQENFYSAYIDYLMGKNDNILKMSKNENLIGFIKNDKVLFENVLKSYKIWENTILPAFNKAKRAISDLEESLKNPDFEKERKERLKTKEKLEGLSSKKFSLEQSLSQLKFYEEQKTELEQYLEKYRNAHEVARNRKKSLENGFWNFGNNFFKLHGNDDVCTFRLR